MRQHSYFYFLANQAILVLELSPLFVSWGAAQSSGFAMIFLELRSGARAQVFMLSKNIASPWLLRVEQNRSHANY